MTNVQTQNDNGTMLKPCSSDDSYLLAGSVGFASHYHMRSFGETCVYFPHSLELVGVLKTYAIHQTSDVVL